MWANDHTNEANLDLEERGKTRYRERSENTRIFIVTSGHEVQMKSTKLLSSFDLKILSCKCQK